MALILFVNVARVTNLEAVKIEFRHLPFHILLLLILLQTAYRLNASSTQDKPPTNSRSRMCLLNLVFSETAISNQRFHDHDPLLAEC